MNLPADSNSSSNHLAQVFGALHFAAEYHKDQKRKSNGEPYINHLIRVVQILSRDGHIEDPVTLCAAALHDVIEDTRATAKDIRIVFEAPVEQLVLELSDDKSLSKDERKQLVLDTIAAKDPRAQIIKIADLISNLETLPPDWHPDRHQGYIDWANQVVSGMSIDIPIELQRSFTNARNRAQENLNLSRMLGYSHKVLRFPDRDPSPSLLLRIYQHLISEYEEYSVYWFIQEGPDGNPYKDQHTICFVPKGKNVLLDHEDLQREVHLLLEPMIRIRRDILQFDSVSSMYEHLGPEPVRLDDQISIEDFFVEDDLDIDLDKMHGLPPDEAPTIVNHLKTLAPERVIFLDHDGVICLTQHWGTRRPGDIDSSVTDVPILQRFDNFDLKAVEVLNEIIRETQAEIVVISSWAQHATLSEMQELYREYSVEKVPIAILPMHEESAYKQWYRSVRVPAPRMNDTHHQRSFDILHFLDQVPSVRQWVAVDDSDLQPHKDFWVKNFVRITDLTTGITGAGIKEKILSYFTDE
jgi:guanosine-3',5'-bis(diphosphate) 3'-pyrophosphohydrolase